MSLRPTEILRFYQTHSECVLVQVADVKGSAPREVDAFMLVGAADFVGTIGGGQLEFIAMDTARAMLRNRVADKVLEVALGPDIGQCCGGNVRLELNVVDGARLEVLVAETQAAMDAAPHVYVFGAGHVGRALARGLAALPYQTTIADTRPDALVGLPAEILAQAVALPEALVRQAKPASAFVVLTHDHALDFLIMGEVLKRGDALYAGLIGSKSKKVQFRRWFYGTGGSRDQLAGLTCPIGAQALGDKRPEIIAALAIAEIIGNCGSDPCAGSAKNASLEWNMGAAHGA